MKFFLCILVIFSLSACNRDHALEATAEDKSSDVELVPLWIVRDIKKVSLGAMAYSLDGTRLAALDTDRQQVFIYDTATYKEVASISTKVLSNPNTLWHLIDENERGVTNSSLGVAHIALSSDNKTLAGATLFGFFFVYVSGNTPFIRLWDVNTGKEILDITGHNIPDNNGRNLGRAWALAFSPDGNLLASGGNGNFFALWDARRGTHLHTLTMQQDLPASAALIAFSPDSNTIACGNGRTIELWDVNTGAHLRSFKQHRLAHVVAFSPNGGILASGANAIDLWDVKTGEKVKTFAGHINYATALAFSPDGNTLVSGSITGNVRLWNVAARGQIDYLAELDGREVGHPSSIASISFSPEGKTFSSVDWEGNVFLWELTYPAANPDAQ